jgi:hypothetical protein
VGHWSLLSNLTGYYHYELTSSVVQLAGKVAKAKIHATNLPRIGINQFFQLYLDTGGNFPGRYHIKPDEFGMSASSRLDLLISMLRQTFLQFSCLPSVKYSSIQLQDVDVESLSVGISLLPSLRVFRSISTGTRAGEIGPCPNWPRRRVIVTLEADFVFAVLEPPATGTFADKTVLIIQIVVVAERMVGPNQRVALPE